jgi:acetyltransferase-like isoleucine patch superfamily enzyme
MNEPYGENTKVSGTIERRSPNGTVIIGRDCLIEGYLVTERDHSRLCIGNNVYIGNQTVIDCTSSIEIEDDVLVSYRCVVSDHDGHSIRYSIRRHDLKNHNWNAVECAPVKICRGAWVGAHAIILKGITIGEGAIIGAGAVVTHDVQAWTIVAGNPATFIRRICEDER